MRRPFVQALAAAVAGACCAAAFAAATPAEIQETGSKYLPWGAEKAGNADGSIPAYSGPIKPPKTYDPSKPGIRPDPFADEKPLFSITGKNMAQYSAKLSEGMKAMLQKYPDYRMDIYPSHRTATYPQYFQANAVKNATSCKTRNDGLGLEGCFGGTPFPFPKTGNEVMWNRLLKFDQYSFKTAGMSGSVVDTRGTRTITGVGAMSVVYPIFDPQRTEAIKPDESYEMIRMDYNEPARKNGEKLLIHDSIDMVDTGRRAWSYLPGQRRVKLSPDIAYDTPSPTGGGASVVDESAVFYGALDRYDFKLVGKREMYIPYNAFKIRDPNACPDEKSETKSFLNPDCMRWELHRVWVVEATVKPGKRHIYPRRTLYWDEDLWGVGLGDAYDSTGKIYRVTHSIPLGFYETTGQMTDEWVTYDLATGAYTRQQNSTMHGGWEVNTPPSGGFFTQGALSGGGVR